MYRSFSKILKKAYNKRIISKKDYEKALEELKKSRKVSKESSHHQKRKKESRDEIVLGEIKIVKGEKGARIVFDTGAEEIPLSFGFDTVNIPAAPFYDLIRMGNYFPIFAQSNMPPMFMQRIQQPTASPMMSFSPQPQQHAQEPEYVEVKEPEPVPIEREPNGRQEEERIEEIPIRDDMKEEPPKEEEKQYIETMGSEGENGEEENQQPKKEEETEKPKEEQAEQEEQKNLNTEQKSETVPPEKKYEEEIQKKEEETEKPKEAQQQPKLREENALERELHDADLKRQMSFADQVIFTEQKKEERSERRDDEFSLEMINLKKEIPIEKKEKKDEKEKKEKKKSKKPDIIKNVASIFKRRKKESRNEKLERIAKEHLEKLKNVKDLRTAIIGVAHTLKDFLEIKFEIEYSTTYRELIEIVKNKKEMDEDIKKEIIGFFNRMEECEYSKGFEGENFADYYRSALKIIEEMSE